MGRNSFSKVAAQIEAAGFAKGYKQAMRDARREFSAAMERLIEALVSGEMSGGSATGAERPKRRPRANSDQARVLKIISTNPGLRGVEIVEMLGIGPDAVHERTVRTALSRLKRRGQIQQQDGGWHVIQSH